MWLQFAREGKADTIRFLSGLARLHQRNLPVDMTAVPPEIRDDPIAGRRVIMAPARAARPQNTGAAEDQTSAMKTGERRQSAGFDSADDPFAEGQEHRTPDELFAVREPGSTPNGPGWQVRVVPNRYPALQLQASAFVESPSPSADESLFPSQPAIGVHEVIVECPQAESSLARLPVEHVLHLLTAYQQRLRALRENRQLAYALIFKNHKAAAGASLPHCHSQLMATPFVPAQIAREHANAAAWFERHQRNVFADILQAERQSRNRLVTESSTCVVLCPFASRFPYEACLLPTRMQCRFEDVPSEQLPAIAAGIRDLLQRYDRLLGDPGYNIVLHNSPLHEDAAGYCWHFEFYPRITGIAGFELGGGQFVNIQLPEIAAAELRAVL